MKGWKKKAILSLGKIVTGKTPSKLEAEYWDGDELFISPKDMERDSLYILNTHAKITKKALNKFKSQRLPKNSIMYTSLSYGFGKIGISPQEVLTNQQITSVITNQENNFRFVYYLLRINTPYIFAYNSGIDTPIVPKSVFEKIELLVPPLPIQKKIAAVLSAYDDLIENNNRRIAILEKMAEELYREWFVRLRFPGHENTKIVKGIPEDWEVKKIGEVFQIKRGRVISSDVLTEGTVPVIGGGITYSNYHNKSNTISPTITISASGANAGFINLYYQNVWASDCSYVDTTITKSVFFAYTMLKSKQTEIFYLQKGSAQPHVYAKDVMNLGFICPNKDILQNFNNILNPIFNTIDIYTKTLVLLKSSRDRLLSRLMGGKIGVEDLDIWFPSSMKEVVNNE